MGSRAVRGAVAAEARTEALRVLRSNLLVAVAGIDHPVVAVTSANQGEGKTTTCAGLARSLASAGCRVVLVDLDLRQPELHQRLGASDRMGVADVLAEHSPLDQAMQRVEPPPDEPIGGQDLYLLAAGASPSNATELLAAPGLSRLLATVASQADIVLVDTAPVLPVADTLVVARLVTGVLLVVEAGRTSEDDVRAARDVLSRSGAPILGVALNKLDAREVRLGYGPGGGAVAALDGGGRSGPRWAPGWAFPPA